MNNELMYGEFIKLTRGQRVLFVLMLVFIAVFSFNQIKDSDSFYHIKAGELIWQTKNIPHTDPFSISANGAQWVAHEWLAEVIFYGVFHVAGFWGLIVFAALMGMLTYALLAYLALKRGADPDIVLFFLPLVAWLTLELWIPRPQIFGFACFALLLFFLLRYQSEGRRRNLLYALIILGLWAQMNASVLLGLVVIFFFHAWAHLKKWYPAWFGEACAQERIATGIAFLVALVVTLANPNGYHIFLYRFEIQEAVRAFNVLEWKPIFVFLAKPQTKIMLFEIVAALGVLFYASIARKARAWGELALLLGISILPFLSIRHVGFWPIVAIPLVLPTFSHLTKSLREKLPVLLMPTVTTVLLIAGILRVLTNLPGTYFNEQIVPVRAADFIEANRLHGPLFNLYNEGGYFLWRLYPQEKVFMDGRSEVYLGRPMQEFFSIVTASSTSEQLVDKTYHFNYMALAYRPESLAKSITPLLTMLAKRHWPLVYWDDTVLIFVRPTIENKAIIDQFALQHVHPFRSPEKIPQAEAQATAKELQTLLDRVSHSQVVANYAAAFVASHPRIGNRH